MPQDSGWSYDSREVLLGISGSSWSATSLCIDVYSCLIAFADFYRRTLHPPLTLLRQVEFLSIPLEARSKQSLSATQVSPLLQTLRLVLARTAVLA